MVSNTPSSEVLATYRTHADELLRAALDTCGDLPIYGMLRYFMGYADSSLQPISGSAGKRIRASLTLLAADLCGGAASANDLAVAVELFHNFTLIHDDIEDNDELRRGRPTVWKLWGLDHGINAGDAQAFLTTQYLLAAASDPHGAQAAAGLTGHFREVIEGQYLDFELARLPLNDSRVTVIAYLDMVRRKTSVLIGAALAAGGVAAGCTVAVRDALYTYGESLGMAYQVADDMASIWGDAAETGKRAYGDIVERKKTHPILAARDHGAHDRLCELFRTSPSESEVLEIVSLLDTTGAREATRALGDTYVALAKQAAREVGEGAEILTTIVDTLVRFTPDTHHSD